MVIRFGRSGKKVQFTKTEICHMEEVRDNMQEYMRHSDSETPGKLKSAIEAFLAEYQANGK